MYLGKKLLFFAQFCPKIYNSAVITNSTLSYHLASYIFGSKRTLVYPLVTNYELDTIQDFLIA